VNNDLSRHNPHHNALRATLDPVTQTIWDRVAWDRVKLSSLSCLWDFEGVSAGMVWRRTFTAMLSDNLLSRAAEMGYYFLFALFPTLVCASSILGLAAQQASTFYDKLLHYLALVVPASARTRW
jgi:membrane protein